MSRHMLKGGQDIHFNISSSPILEGKKKLSLGEKNNEIYLLPDTICLTGVVVSISHALILHLIKLT